MLAEILKRPFRVDPDRPLVLAHRGASADAPENTLAAFREAFRQGADGVELDVMPCASGDLLVCHDRWLDRLAGQHVDLRATDFAKLRLLDVGRRFAERFAGEGIPTLAEALDAIPAGAAVNIELKCEELRDAGLAARVARELRSREHGHSVIVSSFNPLELARSRLLAPRLATAMLVAADQILPAREAAARALFSTALHVEHPLCTRENVRRWHAQGLSVAAWTVDEPSDVERCCEAGVDVLITNRPGATLELARRFGKRS